MKTTKFVIGALITLGAASAMAYLNMHDGKNVYDLSYQGSVGDNAQVLATAAGKSTITSKGSKYSAQCELIQATKTVTLRPYDTDGIPTQKNEVEKEVTFLALRANVLNSNGQKLDGNVSVLAILESDKMMPVGRMGPGFVFSATPTKIQHSSGASVVYDYEINLRQPSDLTSVESVRLDYRNVRKGSPLQTLAAKLTGELESVQIDCKF